MAVLMLERTFRRTRGAREISSTALHCTAVVGSVEKQRIVLID